MSGLFNAEIGFQKFLFNGIILYWIIINSFFLKWLPLWINLFVLPFQSKSIYLAFLSNKLWFARTRSVSGISLSKKAIYIVFKSTVLLCINHQGNQFSSTFCQRLQLPLFFQSIEHVFHLVPMIEITFHLFSPTTLVALDFSCLNLVSIGVLWLKLFYWLFHQQTSYPSNSQQCRINTKFCATEWINFHGFPTV